MSENPSRITKLFSVYEEVLAKYVRHPMSDNQVPRINQVPGKGFAEKDRGKGFPERIPRKGSQGPDMRGKYSRKGFPEKGSEDSLSNTYNKDE